MPTKYQLLNQECEAFLKHLSHSLSHQPDVAVLQLVDKYKDKPSGYFYTASASPLLTASVLGRADIVQLIMLSPSNTFGPSAVNNAGSGGTCLLAAAQRGNTEVAEVLLCFGASVDLCGPKPITPLHQASILGNAAMVALLLAHGADVEGSVDAYDTPLHAAASRRHYSNSSSDHVEVARLLLMGGAVVDQQARCLLTPLSRATKNKNCEMMYLLLDWGASSKSASRSLCRTDKKFLAGFIGSRRVAMQGSVLVSALAAVKSAIAVKAVEIVDSDKVVDSGKVVAPVDDDDCCISCMDCPPVMLLLPCGHVIMCKACVEELISYNTHINRDVRCPNCSEPIVSFVEMGL